MDTELLQQYRYTLLIWFRILITLLPMCFIFRNHESQTGLCVGILLYFNILKHTVNYIRENLFKYRYEPLL